jgi:hypothetical protein
MSTLRLLTPGLSIPGNASRWVAAPPDPSLIAIVVGSRSVGATRTDSVQNVRFSRNFGYAVYDDIGTDQYAGQDSDALAGIAGMARSAAAIVPIDGIRLLRRPGVARMGGHTEDRMRPVGVLDHCQDVGGGVLELGRR